MKILKIEFENINSLRGKHSIDFEKAPFTGSSLFAITGPTGSGKSTILDVISLALFNHVPRLGKISKNEILATGAILTRNQDHAGASITYQCNSGIYTSTWNIETARTGNLKDYHMSLFDLASNKAFDLKKSDVPAKNEELIGLNYNQFIKSVVLAQGDFAQFLRAKKDERGELLEKITGTGIYRQLGMKAFQKHKAVSQEISLQQQARENFKIELLEEEELFKITQELQEKDAECKLLDASIKATEANISLKNTLKKQREEIDILNKQKQTTTDRLNSFIEENGAILEAHEKVQPFGEEIRKWALVQNNLKEHTKELQSIDAAIQTNKQQTYNCLKEVESLTGKILEDASLENELHSFTEKVRDLDKQKSDKLTEYNFLITQLKAEIKELDIKINERDLPKDLEIFNQLKSTSSNQLRYYENELASIDLKNPDAEKSRLEQQLENTRKAGNQAQKIQQLSKEFKKLTSEEEKNTPDLAALPQKIDLSNTKISFFKEHLKNLNLEKQNQLLTASLKEHRSTLIDGNPCPLCGATHHPFADNLPQKNGELDEKISATTKELESWSQQNTEENTHFKQLQKRISEIRSEKELLQNDLSDLKLHFETHFKDISFEKSEEDWEVLFDKQKRQIQELESYQKELRIYSRVSNGIPILEKIIDVLEQGKNLKKELDAIYSGDNINNDFQRLQKGWTQLKAQAKNLLENKALLEKKIAVAQTQNKELELSLQPLLLEINFKDIASAQNALMLETDYLKLRNQREEILKNAQNIQTSLQVLTKQLQETSESDVPENIEQLNTLLDSQTFNYKTNSTACENLRRSLFNNNQLKERIKKIDEEIQQKEEFTKRWRLLNELIGDAQGKKFNEFAQDLTLSQLLYLANIRLKDLSDRYKLDKPENEEDNALIAIDEHMGGQRRSVKTLSGGETFILSLSLALALSDLASRNVEINSLFIDEGFGTLDPETLDQTLDTLEKLQSESSKTIGIISHVDSLKERIATQIQLKRNGQGYSSLDIVPN
ncbi:AAA family ATPase [Gillisia sp. M10.2A]|uniref:AAA family ATPase n=1 Tax=Gillisia lutea TaxID=2909668 RepID=A0ABS9EFY2_9FLAO|nr:AAA family ATPase [Gillisia lutea]MCF4101167.1 AAA family ATPase [Gillisia lutea]